MLMPTRFPFLVAIVILLLFLPMNAGATDQLPMLHINVKENDILHPETKADPDAASQVIRVEAEYEESFIPGLGTSRNNPDWVEVGTWTSSSREIDIDIGSFLEFNVWYQIIDEGYNADSEFQFFIYRDGEQICHRDGLAGGDPGNDDILEIEGSTSMDPVLIEKNASLEYRIEYKAYEDCNFYFDNATYDSGLRIESDFLRLLDMKTKRNQVSLEVFDAFGSNLYVVNSFVVLEINGSKTGTENVEIVEGKKHDFNGTGVYSTILQWTVDENITGGEEVEVWVKYVHAESNEDTGVRMQVVGKNMSKSDGDDFKIAGQDGVMVLGGGLGAAAATGAIAFVRLRGREDEEYEDDDEYEEYGDEEEEEDEDDEEYEDDEEE